MAEIFLGNIRGPKGDTGPQGPKGDPFKYSDFTSEQLDAIKGPKGDTPTRGVDYFTSDDIQYIVDEVISHFGNGDEEKY